MLDFTTGDDFADIIVDNIETSIAYIKGFANSQSEITLPQGASCQTASPVVAPLKKKKGKRGPYKRKVKVRWACALCKSTFGDKQSLKDHMDNIRICQKKQKRLEDAEHITLAPHEELGATLQACIDTLKDHQRLNEPVKAK